MGYNYYHPVYRAARRDAFARSGGLCQLCGQVDATEAHHWMGDYPPEAETRPEHLTALCGVCHSVATAIRRTVVAGGSRWTFKHAIKHAAKRRL